MSNVRKLADGTAIQRSLCPTCGAPLNAATGVDDPEERPMPGDISFCAYCGEILIFDDLSLLVCAKETDLAQLTPEQRQIVMDGQAFVRKVNR